MYTILTNLDGVFHLPEYMFHLLAFCIVYSTETRIDPSSKLVANTLYFSCSCPSIINVKHKQISDTNVYIFRIKSGKEVGFLLPFKNINGCDVILLNQDIYYLLKNAKMSLHFTENIASQSFGGGYFVS